MGRANTEDYEDETVTEVKVEVDVSELGALPRAPAPFHVADAEPPTTQNGSSTKPHPKSSPSSKLPKVVVASSLPADTEPETLDPTYVVSVPGPGAEGEPDTLKPPQTMGVRQIKSSSGPPSATKPGIGPAEAATMNSILEESTSTSSRNAWLEAARKMLVSEPDEETGSVPDLSVPDEQTEKRPRKNVTMRGIAPPPEPMPVKIPPSPPAPTVTTDARRASPALAVYVPPAIRDEKSFLPNLSEGENEVTDRIVTGSQEETDVEARPPVKPPAPSMREKGDHPFETKREPVVDVPPAERPTDTQREPPVPKPPPSSKPAVVNLVEAKKAAADAKLARPATSPIAQTPVSIGQKTMVSQAVSPSAPPVRPATLVTPKKDGAANKTLASTPTAASLLMGATVPTAPPTPPLSAKGGTERPPPLPTKGGTERPPPPPIEDEAPEPKTLAFAQAPPPAPTRTPEPSPPRAPVAESSNPMALAAPAAASAPSVVPAPLPPDAIRRSPGLIAAAIATGVLLLISGIGVGYTLRGADPAPAPSTSVSIATSSQASAPEPAMDPTTTTTSEPPPKAATTTTSEPSPPASVALADPLDEVSPSGQASGTSKPKSKPKPAPTVIPIVKPKPKPKPAPPPPTTAPPPPPPAPPPAAPKGFDPNSI